MNKRNLIIYDNRFLLDGVDLRGFVHGFSGDIYDVIQIVDSIFGSTRPFPKLMGHWRGYHIFPYDHRVFDSSDDGDCFIVRMSYGVACFSNERLVKIDAICLDGVCFSFLCLKNISERFFNFGCRYILIKEGKLNIFNKGIERMIKIASKYVKNHITYQDNKTN